MGRVTGWVRCPRHVPGGLRAPVGASQMPVDDCYRNMHGAFYRDVGAYRALLETPGCLRWDTAFHIFGGLGTWGVLGGGWVASGRCWATLREWWWVGIRGTGQHWEGGTLGRITGDIGIRN